jgi:hypothetical protein
MTQYMQLASGDPDQSASVWRQLIFGNGMLPLYRHGDEIIVSETDEFRVGDRVAVIRRNGVTVAGTLLFQGNAGITIQPGGSRARSVTIRSSDIQKVGRILWASQ